MGFLNHIRVLNIKEISQINLFLIFLKKTIVKYKIKSNFMCISVALFYNYFLCGKRAFLCGESNSSKKIFILFDKLQFHPIEKTLIQPKMSEPLLFQMHIVDVNKHNPN
jgi:hypothetical protein